MKLKIHSIQNHTTNISNELVSDGSFNLAMSVPGGSTTCFGSCSCTCTCGVISEDEYLNPKMQNYGQ